MWIQDGYSEAHKNEKTFIIIHLHTEAADVIFRWSLKVRWPETKMAKSGRGRLHTFILGAYLLTAQNDGCKESKSNCHNEHNCYEAVSVW